MSNEQFQNKYEEVFKSIKEEKMDWNFDDFMNKVEEQPQAPIHSINTAKKSKLNWTWLAASMIVIFGLGAFLIDWQSKDMSEQNDLVEKEVKSQKDDFLKANMQTQHLANNTLDSIQQVQDSITSNQSIAEAESDIDKILPKKSRLKKVTREIYAHNSNAGSSDSVSKKSVYQSNFVTVNGKKIDNMEEAIHVTQYGLQVFANSLKGKVNPSAVSDIDE